MGKNKMKRHEERQAVMGLLYSSSFRKDEKPESILLDLEAGSSGFIEKTFIGALSFAAEADSMIEQDSNNWQIARLSPVTSAILHLAVYELLKTDTPPKVVINEAVELAKEYDDESSPAFVNGILNRIARECGLIS